MLLRTPLALLLSLLVLLSLAPHAVRGQEATPEVEGVPATQPILQVSDAALGSGELALIGFIRTIYDPGAEQAVTSGASPMLLWVESGTLAVTSTQGAGPVVVSDEGPGVAENLSSPMEAGEEFSLEAGQALILPAESGVQVRNDETEPAVTFDLLPAAEVQLEPAAGVNQRLVARHEASVPSSPFVIELGRSTIPPGDQYLSSPNASDTVVVAIDQAQYFSLARNNFNRGTTPMDVYVLTITPVEGGVATPTQ